MFAHECLPADDSLETNGVAQSDDHKADLEDGSNNAIIDEDDLDYDNPMLEKFPSDSRESILAAVRQIETSTEEDRTVFEGIPSPMVSPTDSRSPSTLALDPQLQHADRPNGSLGNMHSDRTSSMSLQSIDESPEEHSDSRVPAKDPDVSTLSLQNDGPASPSVVFAGAKAPVVTLELPSDEDSERDEGISMGKSTAKDSETDNLRKRNTTTPTDRSASSASVHTLREANKDGNWLQAFTRLLFVDWIGGLFSKLFYGNRRKA